MKSVRFQVIVLTAAMLLSAVSVAEVRRYDVPTEGSPSMGPPDAPVTIVEFLDYQ